MVARWAHNPKVVGSSPAPATTERINDALLFFAITIAERNIKAQAPPKSRCMRYNFFKTSLEVSLPQSGTITNALNAAPCRGAIIPVLRPYRATLQRFWSLKPYNPGCAHLTERLPGPSTVYATLWRLPRAGAFMAHAVFDYGCHWEADSTFSCTDFSA